MAINYNELIQFMNEFNIDSLIKSEELLIDEKTNTYAIIKNCENMEDVKVAVVAALSRRIGTTSKPQTAMCLLEKFNTYFNVSLTKDDLRIIYAELCYDSKRRALKTFINQGFPIDELKKVSY